jgi:WD40 repeat protein
VTVWDAGQATALKELRGGKCSEGYSGIRVTWGTGGRIYAAPPGRKILAWDAENYAPVEGFAAESAPGISVSTLLPAPSGPLLAQYERMGLPVVVIIDGQQGRQTHLLDRQVNGGITALAWAPDARRLAVNYRVGDGLTLIWNALTGTVEQEIEGYFGAGGLGWSADGVTLFGLQSLDGQIHAVEVSTGRVLRSLEEHAQADGFLTWTQDGLVSTNGAAISWWDPAGGRLLRREMAGSPQVWVVSWPPAGPSVYLTGGPRGERTVGTAQDRSLLQGDESGTPFSAAWSLDGTRVAEPTGVWDAGSGALLASLHDPAQRHTPDKVAWSPDGSRLASADSLAMQPPVIWDARSGEVLLSLEVGAESKRPLWLALAWSPDGEHLGAVGALVGTQKGEDKGLISVWNTRSGQQEDLLTAGMHDQRLWTVAWSPDGRYLACGTLGSDIFLWDWAAKVPVAKLGGHADLSDQLAWSPDGRRLASVARDGKLLVWDLAGVQVREGAD